MTSWNFSEEPSARPPEMMILAEVSSGRSLSDSLFSTNDDRFGSAAAETSSTTAVLPWEANGKEAVRTVTTRIGSVDCTVRIAFPA